MTGTTEPTAVDDARNPMRRVDQGWIELDSAGTGNNHNEFASDCLCDKCEMSRLREKLYGPKGMPFSDVYQKDADGFYVRKEKP